MIIALVFAALLSVGSYNVGVENEHKANVEIVQQYQEKAEIRKELSKAAINDIEEVVKANFSKVRNDKYILGTIETWRQNIEIN